MEYVMGMRKQAKDRRKERESEQRRGAEWTAIGQSGAGGVTVTLAGGGNMKSLEIDPSLMTSEDKEVVEDLIIAAFQDAKVKLDQAQAETMKSAMGDIQLPPGMKMPF